MKDIAPKRLLLVLCDIPNTSFCLGQSSKKENCFWRVESYFLVWLRSSKHEIDWVLPVLMHNFLSINLDLNPIRSNINLVTEQFYLVKVLGSMVFIKIFNTLPQQNAIYSFEEYFKSFQMCFNMQKYLWTDITNKSTYKFLIFFC